MQFSYLSKKLHISRGFLGVFLPEKTTNGKKDGAAANAAP